MNRIETEPDEERLLTENSFQRANMRMSQSFVFFKTYEFLLKTVDLDKGKVPKSFKRQA